MSETEHQDSANLRTVYQELCASYHGIADFRAKLPGLIPLALAAPTPPILWASTATLYPSPREVVS